MYGDESIRFRFFLSLFAESLFEIFSKKIVRKLFWDETEIHGVSTRDRFYETRLRPKKFSDKLFIIEFQTHFHLQIVATF
jgi:hypothetical protein